MMKIVPERTPVNEVLLHDDVTQALLGYSKPHTFYLGNSTSHAYCNIQICGELCLFVLDLFYLHCFLHFRLKSPLLLF